MMLTRPPKRHHPIADIADYLVGEFPRQVVAILWDEKTPIFTIHHKGGVRHEVVVTHDFLNRNEPCVDALEQLGLGRVMQEHRNQPVSLAVSRAGIQIEPRATMRVA